MIFAFILLFLLCKDIDASIFTKNNSSKTFNHQEAEFGNRLTIDGITGVLIPIQNIDVFERESGCWPVNARAIKRQIKSEVASFAYEESLASYPSNDTIWIALLTRGECSFTQKIRSMQQSGASAVIVGDNIQSMNLISMTGEGDLSDIQIFSVFVSKSSYMDLKSLVYDPLNQFDNQLLIQITKNIENQSPINDQVFIGSLVILSSLVVFLGAYYIWLLVNDQRFPNFEDALDPSLLCLLPIHIFQIDSRKDSDPSTCAVCLEDFSNDDELRVLIRCKHEFHKNCIDPWLLTKSKSCPICKRDAFEDPKGKEGEETPLLPNDELV